MTKALFSLFFFIIILGKASALPTEYENLIGLNEARELFLETIEGREAKEVRLAVHDISFFGHKIILGDSLKLLKAPEPLNLISPHGASVAQLIVDPHYGVNDSQSVHLLTRGIFEDEIEKAVNLWIENEIKLVNLSMSFRSPDVVKSLNRFIKAGGILIASSGNGAARFGRDLPKQYETYLGLTISACDESGHLQDFSHYREGVSLLAPGRINSLPVKRLVRLGHQPLKEEPDSLREGLELREYGFGMTSGSAPVVTGIVSMALTINRNLSQDDVNQFLLESANSIEGKPVINAYAFLKRVISDLRSPFVPQSKQNHQSFD